MDQLRTGAGAVVVIAGLVALWWWNPAIEGPFPACPFFALTGLQCAGCGVLRATHALLHGDLRAAWALNPVYVIALPFALGALVASALGSPWTRRLARWPSVIAVVLVLLLFTVLRNL